MRFLEEESPLLPSGVETTSTSSSRWGYGALLSDIALRTRRGAVGGPGSSGAWTLCHVVPVATFSSDPAASSLTVPWGNIGHPACSSKLQNLIHKSLHEPLL